MVHAHFNELDATCAYMKSMIFTTMLNLLKRNKSIRNVNSSSCFPIACMCCQSQPVVPCCVGKKKRAIAFFPLGGT